MKPYKLNEKEFIALVDLMNDNGMDFELIPSSETNPYVVLKFKNCGFFRCLNSDYQKAVDYINNPEDYPF